MSETLWTVFYKTGHCASLAESYEMFYVTFKNIAFFLRSYTTQWKNSPNFVQKYIILLSRTEKVFLKEIWRIFVQHFIYTKFPNFLSFIYRKMKFFSNVLSRTLIQFDIGNTESFHDAIFFVGLTLNMISRIFMNKGFNQC